MFEMENGVNKQERERGRERGERAKERAVRDGYILKYVCCWKVRK